MKQSVEAAIRAPIVAIMIFQVTALFARAFVETRLIAGGESEPFARDLSYLVVPPILTILLYPIIWQHGPFLLSLLRRHDLTVRLVVLSIMLGITLRLTYWGGLISLISFGALRNSDPDAVVGPVISFACPEPSVLVLSFLVVSFFIPLVEEIINRGLILQSLMHTGKILAVVLSSALFAIVHDPQAIMLAFMVGIFLGVQMINYKTLWAPLITHATYNAVAVLDWDCLSTQWNRIEPSPSMIGIGLMSLAVTFVGFSCSAFLARKRGIAAPEHRDTRDR